jgi:general stress protein 26
MLMYDITRVSAFDDIRAELMERAGRMVYANLATVDSKGRPRSRVVHPVWEGSTVWITGFPDTPKRRHIAANPRVSLAYITETWTPVYADCRAEPIDDIETKRRVWDVILHTPPPMGFDPAAIYGAPDDPRFALLRLTPWRIQLTDSPGSFRYWKPD